MRRIIGAGDLWAAEMIVDYNGDRYYTVLIHEYRDGLVVRETCYYATRFDEPVWRAPWGRARSMLRGELTRFAAG